MTKSHWGIRSRVSSCFDPAPDLLLGRADEFLCYFDQGNSFNCACRIPPHWAKCLWIWIFNFLPSFSNILMGSLSPPYPSPAPRSYKISVLLQFWSHVRPQSPSQQLCVSAFRCFMSKLKVSSLKILHCDLFTTMRLCLEMYFLPLTHFPEQLLLMSMFPVTFEGNGGECFHWLHKLNLNYWNKNLFNIDAVLCWL